MLTLKQIISEATALPDSDKAILIEKIMESMTEQLEVEPLREGVKIAQERLAEIDEGTVQTIPGDVALAQVRQLFGR
ncbi:addiction module protein [Phormidium yuhuli AB48]|uniref:Addiction module protein n=1 Tax=Phormidium yuhuli AB48 TaxID=2940671 RepID=A0ABY5AMF9_9CYAN|nr:addiction module protein [Phormidium yuhuli]USR89439.1 addiction module protein [Phormidium yuhuli AB48]